MARTYRRRKEKIDSYYISDWIPFESKYGGTFYKKICFNVKSKNYKKAKAMFYADKEQYGNLPKEFKKNTEKIYRRKSTKEIYKSLNICNYEEIIARFSRCKNHWSYF